MATLTRLDCGQLEGALGIFETGAKGHVTLPVSAWLIRHPRGTVLFDTGMPAAFADGSDAERVKLISEEVTIGFHADDTVEAQLQTASQDPERVDFVVVSHLHFDHVGGLSMVPNATLIIQRKEWEAGTAIDYDSEGYHERRDYDLGHKLCLIDGTHDIFGDRTLVCIPTPGHTVGHQSLRVRLSTGQQIVLAADCCCFARTLDSGYLQTFGFDLDEQRRSLVHLRKLRDDGAVIVPGHDIDFVGRMPKELGVP